MRGCCRFCSGFFILQCYARSLSCTCFCDRFYASRSEICVYLTKIFSQNQVQKDSWSTLQKGERLEFTHLHVHTEYSLLDGSNKIKEYVARVKELGMDSAAITDHGVMYGVIDFYLEAKAAGINPILGCECMWHRIPDWTGRLGVMKTAIITWCCLQKIIRAMQI